jgi:hypothetical protein
MIERGLYRNKSLELNVMSSRSQPPAYSACGRKLYGWHCWMARIALSPIAGPFAFGGPARSRGGAATVPSLRSSN